MFFSFVFELCLTLNFVYDLNFKFEYTIIVNVKLLKTLIEKWGIVPVKRSEYNIMFG